MARWAGVWLIATQASVTPFWDQWDVEAAELYRPYLTGMLRASDLFAPHNEHRMLFTRFVALGLFIVSGRWDTILQMLTNALLHATAIGVLLFILTRSFNSAGTLLLSLFACLFVAIPFGWESTLWGFCSQNYRLILFATLSLFLLHDSAAFGPRWWLGTLLGIASYFSSASGALTLAAFVVLALMQFLLRQRRGPAELLGIASHAIIVATMVWGTPSVEGHQDIKVHSFAEWFDAAVTLASWPMLMPRRSTLLGAVTALFLFAPALLVAWQTWQASREPHPIASGAGSISEWPCGAPSSFWLSRYGRGAAGYLSSRYVDVFVVGLVVNAACLLRLVFADADKRSRATILFAAAWTVAVFIGAGHIATDTLPGDIAARRETGAIQTANVRQFIQTGDAAVLANKPALHIPYPASERLAELLPTLRSARSLAPDPARRAERRGPSDHPARRTAAGFRSAFSSCSPHCWRAAAPAC